ncbi:hypothetical protein PHAMO_300018 [Magnetospirillum molischianum DSM 120]|uniref:Uncharacterized protein n=1 Tax=Magnetospirillum molischianum DSM 120 TaxID=1150626 RepID=H8FUI7_MAGML|nr:hypothetical protein PHAMO_300018 [Magnetospirillum molischianum DSM 120]
MGREPPLSQSEKGITLSRFATTATGVGDGRGFPMTVFPTVVQGALLCRNTNIYNLTES